jgi:hypothetical protein
MKGAMMPITDRSRWHPFAASPPCWWAKAVSPWRAPKRGERAVERVSLANRKHERYVAHNTMLYEVLVLSSGGERFTMERDGPLADGDTFEQDSESYRVIAVHTGHGPFDGVIEVERFASSEPGAPA